VIEEFADGSLAARARTLGGRFQQRAVEWQRHYGIIGDVRGVGAMQAMELVNAEGEPYAAAAKKLAQTCLRRGVLILTAGTYDNVIRLLMPLTITDEEFEEALAVVGDALHEVVAELGELAVTTR
jgi:4-aminobutyrate aminotransferase/(S)-3-amino-2-methylpropionate transaminase